uniref:Cystinosin homolog n=2 Tax=Mesocestoides corti TaxID=53468 RepID=A0A5K3FM58_MESCO
MRPFTLINVFFSTAALLFSLCGAFTLPGSNNSYAFWDIKFDPSVMVLELGEEGNVSVVFMVPLPNSATFNFTYRDSTGNPFKNTSSMPIQPIAPFKRVSGSNETHQTVVYSNKPGAIKLGLNTTDLNITNIERLHTSITVVRRQSLYVFQQIVGWIYFLSWTISFYPQVILNFTRKSVTGLSFDFIAFNLIGFACYTAFNAGLYFVPYIQEQYFRNHPLGVNPVQLNDLFFSLHATAIVLVQIVQCLIYERGSQRVSKTCTATICMMLIFILISTILAALDVITWLTALYLYSYVKLLVTLIKYLPQVALNCRRRSTVGWSLGNVVCDFVGGVLSVFQMFLIAYNRDDWTSVIGSPTKLILGLISVGFDCIFFGQHHCYGSSGDVVQVDDDGVEESAGLVGDSNQASQASSRDSVPA